jgi:hypothetical protein
MKHLEELKETIKRELEKFAKQGDVSVNTLEKIHKLSDTYKNLCKIEMLEEESEGGYSEARGGRGRGRSSYGGGSSYDDDMMYSERRGRGRNAKRDSMGRYSSEGGSYEGGSSYRGGQGGSSYEGGYSQAKDDMMMLLGEMMEDASPKEREALKKCMRELERD